MLPPVNLYDPVNRSHPLNAGRVAWWLIVPGLDGGKTWYDLMGLYHGALTNMDSASGWRKSSRQGAFGDMQFDGSNDVVTVTNRAPLQLSGNLSIAVTLTPTAFATSTKYHFAGALEKGSGGSVNYLIGLTALTKTGAISSAMFQHMNSGFTLKQATGSVLSTGVPYRLTGTYDGSNIRLYTNGVLSATTAQTSGTLTSSGNVSIGRSVYDASALRFVNGLIDNVSIWNRALSAAEVLADYELSRREYPGVLNRLESIRFPSGATTNRRRRFLAAA